jgi:hypothetical protein
LLRPGYYESTLQSYCLHAGTHGPGKGEGYLNAPLKGSRKKIVQNILLNSVKNPDIPQRNIQILIWAILARTKINDLQSDIRQTANRLLTPDEIKELNGGVLGMIPPQALRLATASLPPFARRILEAENQLRQMLTQSQTNYSSLESIAVLLGDPSESGQNVPRGRWSDHPGGYYIRYLPNSYSQTLVQLYVPENFQSKDKDGKPQEYDPSGDVAVPNNTSRQRLAQSARLFKS